MVELDYKYHKLNCRKCGRKILVEINLFGIDHNATVSAICGPCLGEVAPKFAKKHPEAAIDIGKWLES